MSFGMGDLIAIVNLQMLVSSCCHEVVARIVDRGRVQLTLVLNHNRPHQEWHVIKSTIISQ
jgi:hypothetical protein